VFSLVAGAMGTLRQDGGWLFCEAALVESGIDSWGTVRLLRPGQLQSGGPAQVIQMQKRPATKAGRFVLTLVCDYGVTDWTEWLP
jgi:hypothetical protein